MQRHQGRDHRRLPAILPGSSRNVPQPLRPVRPSASTRCLARRLDVELSYQSARSRWGITIEYNCEVTALEGGEASGRPHHPQCRDRAVAQGCERALFIMVLTGLGSPASPFATSYPGVFAVGDVRGRVGQRVASAVGEGSVVISKVWSTSIRRRPETRSALDGDRSAWYLQYDGESKIENSDVLGPPRLLRAGRPRTAGNPTLMGSRHGISIVRNVASHAASSLAFNFVQNEVTMVAELRGISPCIIRRASTSFQ